MTQAISYANKDEVREVAHRFESCEYALTEFTHARHITVAVVYLAEDDFEAAMAKMRVGLIAFSSHHGKMGYNETITRFWLLAVSNFVSALQNESLADRANAAITHFTDKNLIYRHYTRERLFSPTAVSKWVEPDLHPMG
jgi:hypothetical protein